MSRVMALDVGKKRIGLALSDLGQMVAQPQKAIPIKSSLDVVARELLVICKEKNVSTIVIGLPLELSGEMGSQALYTKKFSDILLRNIDPSSSKDIEVSREAVEVGGFVLVFFDERFTSIGASQVLKGSGLRDKEWRLAKDAISASLILDGYLQMKKSR